MKMGRGLYKNSTTGVTGVHYLPDKRYYRASKIINKRVIYLGYHPTIEESAKAIQLFEEKMKNISCDNICQSL
jgi:hypothetical protein